MENFRRTVMTMAHEIKKNGLPWSESLKKSWAIYRGKKNTVRREKLLIVIYNNNSSYAFNSKKLNKKQKALSLLNETRARYNNLPTMKSIALNTSYESISCNGRFSLD